MAFQTQGDSDEVLSEINITPLVDVMLVLLVVFIIAAPLLTNAVHVNLPETVETAPPEENKAVSVAIDAEGKVLLDERELDLEALASELDQLKRANPDTALHFQADKEVSYGQVAKVLAIIEKAGITKMSVLTLTE